MWSNGVSLPSARICIQTRRDSVKLRERETHSITSGTRYDPKLGIGFKRRNDLIKRSRKGINLNVEIFASTVGTKKNKLISANGIQAETRHFESEMAAMPRVALSIFLWSDIWGGGWE